MNKAITDGLVLMPPAFESGLDVWSREDGTPGSASYDGAANAAFVPADEDFGGCLELQKTEAVQKLRYMGQTPLTPGCYLRIRARVKAISGNLPTVRIAGWAGGAGEVQVTGVQETGPEIGLTEYGRIVTVEAIVGSGARPGVDMPWGTDVIYGHFGLDLTGQNGGVVRIDDLSIEDVTDVFFRQMMDWVDVRDYGAVGDGVTDDAAAFAAADTAASGRQLLVPAGSYFIGSDLTLSAFTRFEGTIVMPETARLALRRNYNLPAYIDAFGDEELAFRKAFQALLNFTDHESLDMGGRRIELTAPIDLAAAVGNKTTFEVRRVIRNGQFNAQPGAAWDPEVVTSTAAYSASNPYELTNVANVANVPVGSVLSGVGVGREVYVRAKNVAAGTVTLSQGLHAAPGSQTYTFTRFRYILDFAGFDKISKFILTDIEFLCNGLASGVILAPEGISFHVHDSYVTKPRDRGVTSPGRGCQGLQIDRCTFNSNEQSVRSIDRTSIAFNVNANDAKIRSCRFNRFGHTGILHGSGHLLVGNHWFQGDDETDSPRIGGMVFTQTNVKSVITGNYIDNCFIEWTNEHDFAPEFNSEFSFGGLTITGNVFAATDVAPWFTWIVVKPYGPDHFIHGMSVQGNTFKAINGNIDRVERVDDSIAGLQNNRTRNIVFEGNTFNGINQEAINPVSLKFAQNTAATNWVLDVGGYLPFGGWARTIESVVAEGPIETASGAPVWSMPHVTPNFGTNKSLVQVSWPEACQGVVRVVARMDNPV